MNTDDYEYNIEVRYKSFLEASAMLQWSTELPTKEGAYWAYTTGDTKPVVIEIMITKSGLPLSVGTIYSASDFEFWIGPLPTPELPK